VIWPGFAEFSTKECDDKPGDGDYKAIELRFIGTTAEVPAEYKCMHGYTIFYGYLK
jgi:hypothetical protein